MDFALWVREAYVDNPARVDDVGLTDKVICQRD
jgi:hypothetical protein